MVEEEVGKSGSLASMSCMTMRVTLTPFDEAGQLYVPLDFGQAVAESAEVETEKEIKN